jgi:plasmid stabilization system protein ParE
VTRRRLIFHPKVEEDLDAIIAHYAARDPALPGRFRARLMEQAERIELFPESGAILFESYRRALLKRFPHMVCTSLATTGLSCSPSSMFVAIPPGSKLRSPSGRMPSSPQIVRKQSGRDRS